MKAISILDTQKQEFNRVVSHPLQSYEWGEFRKKTGITVIREGFIDGKKLASAIQMTIHPIPHTPWSIGYLPKGSIPTQDLIKELIRIGKQQKCIFIQLEPNVEQEQMENDKWKMINLGLKPSAHPLFTKYTFVLDLTKSEEELLQNMHHKTRYNIKVAQKKGVIVVEDNSDEAFEAYLRLTKETTIRQKFYAHTEKYHRLMWETLKDKNSNIEYRNSKQIKNAKNKNSKHLEHLGLENSDIVSDFGFRASDLSAHLLTASYQGKIIVAWILFVFKDTLYYPYGASASQHREVMASNLMMWEAIRFGKKLGLKKFDLWGALGPTPDPKDPWYGFHRFKEGYGARLVEFIGSYDLVINPYLYEGFKVADKLRWFALKLKAKR